MALAMKMSDALVLMKGQNFRTGNRLLKSGVYKYHRMSCDRKLLMYSITTLKLAELFIMHADIAKQSRLNMNLRVHPFAHSCPLA